jgi:2-oxo-hept-3-ene-1,7-dioate hydratase
MLTDDERHRGAEDLYNADRERRVIPQLSRTFPAIELEDAYAIQSMWAQKRIADGAQIPAGRFMSPRLEVELAFVMSETLEGPGIQIYDVMRATEFVVPALEIIDYRTEVPRAITDTIADNAAAGGMIVGGRTVRPMDVDIRWVGATLSKNGIIEESGVSAAIMGHPAAGIAWLVNKLHAVGARLEKGQIVLAGSFTRPVSVAPGDVIHADYGPLGAIGVSFV